MANIRIYVTGYYQALLDSGLKSKSHTDEPFFDWIANKLGFYESTAGWANMITASTIGVDWNKMNWDDFLELKLTQE